MEPLKLAIRTFGSKGLATAIVEMLISAGYTDNTRNGVKPLPEMMRLDGSEIVIIPRKKGMQIAWESGSHASGYKIIDSISELAKILALPQVTKVRLNGEYAAEVSADRKTVKVGCQTFDAARVLEVARIIEGK